VLVFWGIVLLERERIEFSEQLLSWILNQVQNDGLFVQDDGLFVQNDGLFVQDDGLFVQDDGLFVQDDGLFVQNDGLFVQNDGLFVQDDAYSVIPCLTRNLVYRLIRRFSSSQVSLGNSYFSFYCY